jgi:hypothetical protein
MRKAAAIYFGLVFGIGFLLGVIRVLVVVPLVGTRYAELLEAPLMLLAMTLAARWLVRRFCRRWPTDRLLTVGGLAVGLVLVADFAVGVGLRGMTPQQVLLDRDPIAGTVYYGLLLLYALMPAIQGYWLMGK